MRGYLLVGFDITGDGRDREVWQEATVQVREELSRAVPEHRPDVYLTFNVEHQVTLERVMTEIKFDQVGPAEETP